MLDMALTPRDEVARRLFLDKAWHAFIADRVELDGVDPEILRSWRRARDTFGVDPALRRCARLLTPSELASRRERDDVYRLAAPLLQEFGARLAPTRHVLAYFDPAGWMLSMNGAPDVAELTGEINFSPGANWSEASVGTNGPGTALAEKTPVKVFATEHYVEAWQAWTCSAAPIVEPGTSALVGLIDITGPWQAHQVQAVVAARAIAQAIQERLHAVESPIDDAEGDEPEDVEEVD
jgi:transcriptional regulator of acetoin/glycerol metabolism